MRLAAAALLCGGAAATYNLYVTSTGSDGNVCDENSPCATPGRALAEVGLTKAAHNGVCPDDFVIHVGAGTYYLEQPLIIGVTNSCDTQTLTIVGDDPAGRPILSAGIVLPNISAVAGEPGVYTTTGKWYQPWCVSGID